MKLLSDSINVFVEEKDTGKGKSKFFKTTIGSKNEDGTYLNKGLEVSFAKDAISKENLEKLVPGYAYQVEVRDGFLTCRSYQDKNNKKVVVLVAKILKCRVTGRKEISQKPVEETKEDFPF